MLLDYVSNEFPRSCSRSCSRSTQTKRMLLDYVSNEFPRSSELQQISCSKSIQSHSRMLLDCVLKCASIVLWIAANVMLRISSEIALIISQVCFYAPLDCSAKLIFKMLFLLSACYALTENIKSKAPEWWWSARADDSHVQQNYPLFFSTTWTFLSSAKLLISGGSFPSVRLKLWPLSLILLIKCKSAARYRSFCVGCCDEFEAVWKSCGPLWRLLSLYSIIHVSRLPHSVL
jgi:hypothetical protein